MKIWIDAQLPPSLSTWINESFKIESFHVRDLGLRDATDEVIFNGAKLGNVVVMTKDYDFIKMLEKFGPPPKIIWITLGNTSNQALRKILGITLNNALEILESGENMVEILDKK